MLGAMAVFLGAVTIAVSLVITAASLGLSAPATVAGLALGAAAIIGGAGLFKVSRGRPTPTSQAMVNYQNQIKKPSTAPAA